MRVCELRGAFGLENLAVADRATPAPGAREVLVRLEAASLNYRDLLMVRGTYNPKQKLPLIPCSDGAGVVTQVGAAVTRFAPGDRVAGAFAQGWLAGEPTREKSQTTLGGPLDGTLTEYRVFDEQGLVRVPEHLTSVEAATLPCAAVTAWRALVEHGGLLPGQTVLVQGTGGVSVFALQFAKMLGARVIVTSSSDEKLARARGLGADECINYRANAAWGKTAHELTGGRGVDVVVEVGGAGTINQSLRAVRPGGRVSVIGVLAGNAAEVSLLPLLMQDVRMQGVFVGPREHFEAMNRAIALGALRPVVDKTFALEDSRAAFEHMAAGAHFGKICVTLS